MFPRKTINKLVRAFSVFVFLLPLVASAQLQKGMHEMNLERVLPTGELKCSFSAAYYFDSNNILWYTDENRGLSEFDGYNSIYHSFENSDYISEEVLLLTQIENRLFISISRNEIIFYDHFSKQSYDLSEAGLTPNDLANYDDLASVIQLDENVLLILSKKYTGIIEVDISDNHEIKFTQKKLSKSLTSFLQDNTISRLYDSKNGAFWAAGMKSVFKFEYNENGFDIIDSLAIDLKMEDEPMVHYIYEEDPSSIWILAGCYNTYSTYLFNFRPKQNKVFKYENYSMFVGKNPPSTTQFSKILMDDFGQLWVHVYHSNLMKYQLLEDGDSLKIDTLSYVYPNVKYPATNYNRSIRDIRKDSTGGVWIFTDKAVLKHYPDDYQFSVEYAWPGYIWNSSLVLSMDVDTQSMSTYATTTFGYIKKDSSGYERIYRYNDLKKIPKNKYLRIAEVQRREDSTLVIATTGPINLYQYDRSSKNIREIGQSFLGDDFMFAWHFDDYNDAWLWTNKTDTSFQFCLFPSTAQDIISLKTNAFNFDSNSDLCRPNENQLLIYKRGNRIIEMYELSTPVQESLLSNPDSIIFQNEVYHVERFNDSLFVSSLKNGDVVFYNLNQEIIIDDLTLNLPTPVNMIHRESDSTVWLKNFSYDFKIYYCNLNTSKCDCMDNYLGDSTKPDFFTGQFSKSLENKTVIPFRGGFYTLEQSNLLNTQSPSPVFRNLRYNSPSQNAIELTISKDGITKLPPNSNEIEIFYSAAHYKNPEQNSYQYRIKGLNNKWINNANKTSLKLTYLKAGNYEIELKAANSDGLWSDNTASFKFRLLAPWYWSNPMKLVYLGLIVLALYLLFKYRERQSIEKAQVQKLKELDALRTKLYTNITHEFRTPLTVIQGIADHTHDKLNRDQKRSIGSGLNMIKRSGDRLLNLVNQMLDLDKMEAGKYKINYIQSDLVAYLRYLTDSFQSVAESKDINLTFYSESSQFNMDFDPESLQKLVTNLLSNALKYTPKKGQVVLHFNTRENKESNQAIIKITDSGIGIPEEALEHIFDRFYRIGDEDQDSPIGTGIGLALSKELVQAMRGEILVKSTPGQGSEFTIILPVANTKQLTEPAFIPQAIDDEQDENKSLISDPISDDALPNALIVEDNRDVAKFIALCLRRQYNISYAADGKIGLQKALSDPPDILLADVMMPNMNGIELLNALKENEATSHIPVILITARSEEDDIIKGYDAGADAYLLKPFNKMELLVRMEKLIESRQRLREKFSGTLNPNANLEVSTTEEKFLSKLARLVEENLTNSDYGPEKLCKDLSLSNSQVYRKIKYLTGKSTSLYIRWLRLMHALKMLENTEMNISEIAYSCGFKNVSWFSRAFKKEFGYPPSEIIK